MPTALLAPAVASSGTKLYAVGGYILDTLEIYESTTDSWSTGAPMRTGRHDLAAVIVGNTLFAIGGWDTRWQISPVVELLTSRRALVVGQVDGKGALQARRGRRAIIQA